MRPTPARGRVAALHQSLHAARGGNEKSADTDDPYDR